MFSRRTLFSWAAALVAASFVKGAKPEMPKPRLCIWAAHRTAGNPVAAQRGDVVDILDTTRHPGLEVWPHPDWRIVDVDIQVDNARAALAWLVASGNSRPEGYMPQFRRETIDLDKLERLTERRLGRPLAVDDILSVTPQALRALARTKLLLPDPRIIRA